MDEQREPASNAYETTAALMRQLLREQAERRRNCRPHQWVTDSAILANGGPATVMRCLLCGETMTVFWGE
jgi:hypothetical protein